MLDNHGHIGLLMSLPRHARVIAVEAGCLKQYPAWAVEHRLPVPALDRYPVLETGQVAEQFLQGAPEDVFVRPLDGRHIGAGVLGDQDR